MAYLVLRRYSGRGTGPADETLAKVQSELFPKLKEAGGLLRYTTLVMDDGGIASSSVYENKEAAQRGVQVAAEVVSKAQFLQGYKLDQVLEGEIARRIAITILKLKRSTASRVSSRPVRQPPRLLMRWPFHRTCSVCQGACAPLLFNLLTVGSVDSVVLTPSRLPIGYLRKSRGYAPTKTRRW